MSRCFRKPTIGTCENKAADQFRSNCVDDQRLCFCYNDSIIPLLKSLSSFLPASMPVQLSSETTLLALSRRGSNAIITCNDLHLFCICKRQVFYATAHILHRKLWPTHEVCLFSQVVKVSFYSDIPLQYSH